MRSDGGEAYDIAARYLIGADGGRSVIRALIGAKMESRYGVSCQYNIIFCAPGLAETHEYGPAVIYWPIGRDGADLILVRPDQHVT